MPIYEYRCQSCQAEFETLVRAGSHPTCPSCSSDQLERLLSLPAIKSDTTHDLAMRAARKRDAKQAQINARVQREYELSHND